MFINIGRKFIIIFLFIISVSFFVLPQKTYAQIPVTDGTHIGATIAGWFAQASRWTADKLEKLALETLKKRLLDTMVDQIIVWIQGGGTPKFVQDFGGTVEDAANAAVGDVVEEIGLGRICQPFKLPLQLIVGQTARFSQQVSCTLDQIVDNFEGFYDDFRAGGWIGFNELIKPQNNYYGVLISTLEETDTRAAMAREAKSKEIQAGQGFLSQKECLEWSFSGYDINTNDPITSKRVTSSQFPFYDPQNPPQPDSSQFYGEWKCTNNIVTTPGTTIAHGLEKALYSDFDYLNILLNSYHSF